METSLERNGIATKGCRFFDPYKWVASANVATRLDLIDKPLVHRRQSHDKRSKCQPVRRPPASDATG